MAKGHSKVNLTSSDLSEQQLAKLRQILPEAFSEDKIDFEKLRAVLGDNVDARLEKFGFTWAGKSNAIKNVLIPSKLTLRPQKDESVKFDESKNIFIEGDNLEVLKLLQKTYFEKVKMIYIDPPYNTGGDFVYKDNFTAPLQSYKEQTGQTDEEGNKLQTNSETSGRFHSDWLSMMYPRLKLAWNLLRDDGVIAISIGDEEVHHLRILLNEIFGEENFQGQIHWRRRHNQPNDKTKMIGLVAEHIVVFTKNAEVYKTSGVGKVGLTGKFSNPDNDPRGDWASKPWKTGSGQTGTRYKITTPSDKVLDEEWMGDEETYAKLLNDNRIIFPRNGEGFPRKKYFKSEREDEGQCANNWWDHKTFGSNQDGTNELESIFGIKSIFDNPKPTKLIENLITVANVRDGDIVFDFFAGSATTAHAIASLNQSLIDGIQWVLVQLPEVIDARTCKEACDAGYKTIAELSRARIKKVYGGYGDDPQSMEDGFKAFKLDQSNYHENEFDFDPERSEEENQAAFKEYLGLVGQTNLFENVNELDVVYENITKEGLSLNSKVEEKTIEKNKVYHVSDDARELFVCLDSSISNKTVKTLCGKEYKENTFICIDTALDDSAKANLGLNLELKTI